MTDVLVIGAGPAGLMAADVLSAAGHSVVVAEAKPSVGRKFLMAGKSGLNLTKDAPFEAFLNAYEEAAPVLRPMLEAFGPTQAIAWAEGLGQEMFTGSSGRVFPKAMKASPLLRAWLGRLDAQGVEVRTRWRWIGGAYRFETPEGVQEIMPKVCVLACGGASWARLGSDGAWAEWIDAPVAPFQPANMGFEVEWSPHMAKHFGTPVKNVELQVGANRVRAEFVISARGLEGGGIYAVSRMMREGQALTLDLLPDMSLDAVRAKLAKPRGKASLTNFLRKALKLPPEKLALLMEFARPLPQDLASVIKALHVTHLGPRPMDEAISTAGGLRFDALDASLMMTARPGVFAAGEMLDWEAPTGGYLLTACLATGRWAGDGAVKYLSRPPAA
ncbi:putative thiazole biosynthetic enzyme [Shimia sp. SK013]|uniref:TIGR03862 family flavoprotein n=1 Tax=Shimia sp. SK013 TaxID=1389006 RepID=UPI0006B460F6|nr:TIGR03862 family flavoprotein [Shimia sp. SK013]KPA21197.1 putative thiazole biosynthetic enzyme [Shimia sp. SK013]